MSNHLISEAYRRNLGTMARKSVMVLMADKASDNGCGIWASKQRMADELDTTKQTVITTIKSLIADGLIRQVGERRCSTGYTVEYAINLKALQALPLVRSHSDDQSNDLTGKAALPVKQLDGGGQAALREGSSSLTQTLLNHPEPKERALARPDDVSEQVWKDFTKVRKDKRAEITHTALAGLRREATKAGWTLEQALTKCLERGWQGFEAGWLSDAKGVGHRQEGQASMLDTILARDGAG